MGTFNNTHRWLLIVLSTFIEESVSIFGYNEDGDRMEWTPEGYGRAYGFALRQAMEAYDEAQATYMALAKAKAEVAQAKDAAREARYAAKELAECLADLAPEEMPQPY